MLRSLALSSKDEERLRANDVTLTTLHLSGNRDVWENNRSRTFLDMTANWSEAEGIDRLAAALGKNNTLTTLNLVANAIGDQGAQSIVAALENHSTLTTLLLSLNLLKDPGAGCLATLLQKSSTLTTLNLRGNLIGSRGAEKLADALKKNCTLTMLNLTANQVGAQGVEKLASALEQNCTLISLHLCMNNIEDDGAVRLARMLVTNGTLKDLDLASNRIGYQGYNSLLTALQKNITLEKLALGFHDTLTTQLAATLEKNRAGLRVLTVHWKFLESHNIEIKCMNPMTGDMVATVELEPGNGLVHLREAMGEVCNHRGHWRFTREDGRLIEDPTDALKLSEILQPSAPSQRGDEAPVKRRRYA